MFFYYLFAVGFSQNWICRAPKIWIFAKKELILIVFFLKFLNFDSVFSRFWLKIDSFCGASESKKAQKSEKAEFHNPTFPEQTNK